MKWWTSAQAQSYFGKEMESLLGASARYPTANLEAMGSLGWTAQASRVLTAQAAWAKAVPEVPGGIICRAISTTHSVPRPAKPAALTRGKAILTYAQVIDDEVAQKNEEFGLNS